MKVVLRGGYNKLDEESFSNSFWYQYSSFVDELTEMGKKVAMVTLAKPDGVYDDLIQENMKGAEVIDSQVEKTSWGEFDAIFIPGGKNLKLRDGLKRLSFGLGVLKEGAFVLGDSAGAYMLSSFFFESPSGEDKGKTVDFYEGFNPQLKTITIAHADNSWHTNELLIEKVKNFAKERDLSVLKLKENEEKVFVV